MAILRFTSIKERQLFERDKQLIDNELDLYRKRRMLEVEKDILNARVELQRHLEESRKATHDAEHEYEHEFHENREILRTELVALDAEIKHKKELLGRADSIPELEYRAFKAEADAQSNEAVIKQLNTDVKRLNDLVEFLAGMLPKVELDKIGVTLNADVKVSGEKK
ncbi:MAG TPA: hypothetical protein VN039_01615 [Nitrospira sp.]|nr:hypothetical protein [Nitrospira sp.]